MRVSNPLAVIALGVLVGAVTNLSLIGAQAYLLSQTQAIYALYLATFAGLLFSLFLNRVRVKIKFATFASLVSLGYAALFFLLSRNFLFEELRVGLWFTASIFGIGFFKWIGMEMILKYLDPVRAQSYFSYQTTADELGIVASVLAMKTFLAGYGPLQLIGVAALLYVFIAIGVALQFMPRSNAEYRFTKKPAAPAEIEKPAFKKFLFFLILLTASMGLFRVSEDYLLRVILKDRLGSFEAIKDITADYILIASLLTMGLSILVGYLIKLKRVSPIFLSMMAIILMLGASILCLALPTLQWFVTLEVVRLVCSNCLYVPANRMIHASFVGDFRNRIRSTFYFYYFTILGVPMALVFSFTHRMGVPWESRFILVLLLISLALALVAVFRLKAAMVKLMYAFLNSGHKTAAILAAQSLSFLRPREFSRKMRELLAAEPKKLLRKTIVLGLGYSSDPTALDAVIEEFSSDKEEIQMAALDALKVSRDYKGVQFMVNVAMARNRSSSLRIRMSAVFIMVGMFGRKAIPFLLNELEDSNPRIVANILEALSLYRDKSLASYFHRFKESPEPRVRGNALMGLGLFRSTREEYRRGIEDALLDGPAMMASALYVIGKLKDKYFRKYLNRIYAGTLREQAHIKATLAWALTRLEDSRGFDLMGEILSETGGGADRFLHFFSQLPKETRFDAILYLVERRGQETGLLKKIGNALRHSIFDFHEEIEYLHLIASRSGRGDMILADAPLAGE